MTVVLFALSLWNGLRTDLVCTVRFAPPVSRDSVSFVTIAVVASVRPIAISFLLPRYVCPMVLIDLVKLFWGVEESFAIFFAMCFVT